MKDIFKSAKFGDHYVYDDGTNVYDCIFCDEFLHMDDLCLYELTCNMPYIDESGEMVNDVRHIYSPSDGCRFDGGVIRKSKCQNNKCKF